MLRGLRTPTRSLGSSARLQTGTASKTAVRVATKNVEVSTGECDDREATPASVCSHRKQSDPGVHLETSPTRPYQFPSRAHLTDQICRILNRARMRLLLRLGSTPLRLWVHLSGTWPAFYFPMLPGADLAFSEGGLLPVPITRVDASVLADARVVTERSPPLLAMQARRPMACLRTRSTLC